MNNTCPNCGSIMVVKPPAYHILTYPPKYPVILWCKCGHTEDRGFETAPTAQEMLETEWERINKTKSPAANGANPKTLNQSDSTS